MTAAFALCVFALGASVGSLLNVVVYRLPVGASVVRPASRCPACETPIKLRHNVPVLGWLLLRGRCHSCGVAISARYPLIELAGGLIALALFVDFAGGAPDAATLSQPDLLLKVVVPFVLYFAFAAVLIACAFIDLDWFLLPDALTLPAIVVGLLATVATGGAIGVTWQSSALGAAIGAAVILVIILVYGAITGRAGMGGGDWKLLAAIGAWLGAPAVPFVLAAGAIQGVLFAAVFRRSFAVAELPPDPMAPEASEPPTEPLVSDDVPFRKLAVPFGPFLALAALELLLFRDELRALARDTLHLGL